MNFITKKHIPRRTFLRGAGVTLALPFLEAMAPAQTPMPGTPARFVGVWHPHGAAPGWWHPKGAGKDFEFSFITEPFKPLREYALFVSGLDATSSMSTAAEAGGDHQRGAAFLTGARPKRDSAIPTIGISIDQIIAKKFGTDTLLPSIELAIEDPGNNTGSCNYGYSCAYTNSIAWMSPTQPLPHQINPRKVFQRLFGDGSTPEERAAGIAIDKSILDKILRNIGPIRNRLGNGDKARLDTYLDDIRELERRLERAEKASVAAPESDVPFGVPASFDEHVRIMSTMIKIAFSADITRVATLMLGRDSTNRRFPESGFDGPWHGTSHHNDNPAVVKNYAMMNRYHVQLIADFAGQLKATADAAGNLLDHSLIYMGSNMGNSHRHEHENVPVILAGRASGRLETGRHIEFPLGKERTSNLLLALLEKFGIEREFLGDSTGRLSI
jgi:Protein of unknown function (DUF1552)